MTDHHRPSPNPRQREYAINRYLRCHRVLDRMDDEPPECKGCDGTGLVADPDEAARRGYAEPYIPCKVCNLMASQ